MIQITLPDNSRREFPGPVSVADGAQSIRPALAKMTGPELATPVPLVLLTIWYAIHPHQILDAFAAPTEMLIKNYQAALTVAKTALAAAQ